MNKTGSQLSFLFLDFILFGEGAGDSVGPQQDDDVTGSIPLPVPVVYFGTQHTSFHV